ncbi:MAG: Mut7-C ubiquitin/RNAse domain-containing protein [Calditrichaeota bacterium]|nr:Mut7-C ubiquitin/RNAse domain-containing protein [Calditrichota bacterium]
MAKPKQAIFRFYAELNDFLPRQWRQKEITYRFWGAPAVKDAIEALGVPHPEVDLILVNNQSVDFSYSLQEGDRVAVYPTFELFDISEVTRLRCKPLRKPCFILDCNLGKLARKLRMLGFDSLYQNDFQDKEIIDIALKEHRIILTRDIGLLKNNRVTHGYWVRQTDPGKQLEEVLNKFDLYSQSQPFTRCLDCNGLIEAVPKEKVIEQIPPKVQKYFNEFYRCVRCSKIYWEGSHYERMHKTIKALESKKPNRSSGG